MTEEEFDYFYPAPQENEQAAAASDLPPVAEALPFFENTETMTAEIPSGEHLLDQIPGAFFKETLGAEDTKPN